jgi:hypothetical protein
MVNRISISGSGPAEVVKILQILDLKQKESNYFSPKGDPKLLKTPNKLFLPIGWFCVN